MNDRRPVRIIAALAATAIVSVIASGLLDVHGKWGEPRQAAANVLWIVFVLSALATVIATARLVFHRRRAEVRG